MDPQDYWHLIKQHRILHDQIYKAALKVFPPKSLINFRTLDMTHPAAATIITLAYNGIDLNVRPLDPGPTRWISTSNITPSPK